MLVLNPSEVVLLRKATIDRCRNARGERVTIRYRGGPLDGLAERVEPWADREGALTGCALNLPRRGVVQALYQRRGGVVGV